MHFSVTTLCQPHSVVLWDSLKVSTKYELQEKPLPGTPLNNNSLLQTLSERGDRT
jgi:hypothetical protein